MAGPKNAMTGHLRPVVAGDKPDLSGWMGREQVLVPVLVQLGPCECPGRPHEDGDWAMCKARMDYGEVVAIQAAAENGEPGDGTIEMLFRGVISWNLTTRTGAGDEPLDIDRLTFRALSGTQGQTLSKHFSTVPLSIPLPNDAGATSAPMPADSDTSANSTGDLLTS